MAIPAILDKLRVGVFGPGLMRPDEPDEVTPDPFDGMTETEIVSELLGAVADEERLEGELDWCLEWKADCIAALNRVREEATLPY